MSNIGEALLTIKVDVKVGDSLKKLEDLFEKIKTKADEAAKGITSLNAAVATASTNITTAATGATSLATSFQNASTSATALDKTLQNIVNSASAVATATQQATASSSAHSSSIAKGIALIDAGAKANLKYRDSLKAIKEAQKAGAFAGADNVTMAGTGKIETARRNVRRERDQATFSEALRRSKLSSDPAADYFRKQAQVLAKDVVNGTIKATEATKRYFAEVKKLAEQGGIKDHNHLLKIGRALTDEVRKAQQKLNAESAKKSAAALAAADKKAAEARIASEAASVSRGRDIAAPEISAGYKLKKDIDDVNTALKRGNITKKQAADAIKKLTAEYNKAHSSFSKFQAKAQQVGRSMQNFSTRIRDAGRQLVFFGGAVLGSILPVIKANAQFEQSVQDVAAVLGGIGKNSAQLKSLSDQFLELGENSEFTAVQVAEGAKTLSRAGFSAREVQQSLSGVVSLASSAGISLDDAARVAVNITKAFQLSADSFGFVADRITAIAVNSNAAVQDIAESFKYVSPIAASFGQSIESIGAAIGVLANAGTRGSRAGTGLSRFFSELVEPRKVAKIQELLASVGESVDSLVPEDVDLRDMIALLDKLMSSRKISASDISQIFDQRSTRAVLSLLNQGIDEFDKMYEKIADSSTLASEIRTQRLDTLQGDWLRFTSALNTSMITLGETVNSDLRDALQYATFLLRQLTESFKDSDGTMLKTIGTIGAISLALGTLLTVVGSIAAVVAAIAVGLGAFVGPVLAIGAAVGILVGLLGYNFFQTQLETATKMAEALRNLHGGFKDVNEAIKQGTKETDKMREAIEKLRRFSELKPVEIENLMRGGRDPFDTSTIDKARENLRKSRGELSKEQQAILKRLKEIEDIQNGWFAGYRDLTGESARLQQEATILQAELDEIIKKQKQINDLIFKSSGLKNELKDIVNIMGMGYSEATAELERTKKELEEVQNKIDEINMSGDSSDAAKMELELAQWRKEGLDANATQLARQLADDPRSLEITNKIGVLQGEINRLMANGAPAAEIENRRARLAALFEEQKNMNKALKEETDAINAGNEAREELDKFTKERRQRGMSDIDKKLEEMLEAGIAETTALELASRGAQAKLAQSSAQIARAEEILFNAQISGDADKIKAAEEALQNLKNRIDEEEKRVKDLAKLKADLPIILADEMQKVADDDKLEKEAQILDITRKAALEVARKTKNLAEELRLLKEIADVELERQIEDLKAKGATPQEIAKFRANKEAMTQSELDEITESRTTAYLDEIDKMNLADAKRNNNLAEQIRLTEKLGKAEIARQAKDIADAGIRQQFEDAKNRELEAELEELRRSAVTSSPVDSMIKKIESRDSDVLNKRVENQDKIRDALASQVRSLQDAQMLNAYLFRLEKARESSQNKARLKALYQSKRLQSMAARGASEWALARQFSESAQALDFAKRMGVSDLALSPASNVIASLPANVPGPQRRPMPGGPGTSNVNSNNNTVTIEAGAIVISGVEDTAEVEKVVKDVLQDMLNPGPKKKKVKKG